MSRIGRQPITIPNGVTVSFDETNFCKVKGPKGELSRAFSADLIIKQESNVITVDRPTNQSRHRQLHGLTRTLIANMVHGVNEGYSKMLEVVGVGYRAEVNNNILKLNVGYAEPKTVEPRPGITFEAGTDQSTRAIYIKISGVSKEMVGQTTAEVQKIRMPDKYKGKGIRFFGEKLKLKAGKRSISGGKK